MALRMARQAGLAAALLGISFLMPAQAQDPAPGQQAPLLAPEQLNDLVAPIALYPDPLLSQVLVASTYPLELVEAQQWLQRSQGLSGQQLTAAARQQNWDASVQALVAFPDVLARLNQDMQWATALGNAFLAQQSDVMAAVQQMRARAQADGRLSSTPQQTVTTETQNGQAAIEIAPANPQVIYVPTYDPSYVWGPPAYGYPSLYYGGYGFGFGMGIDMGFCFGGWGGWGWGGGGWGWGPNWFGRSVFVNGPFFQRYGFRGGQWAGGYGGYGGRSMWQHDPMHRLGVSYPNRQLAGRYQAASLASRASMTRSGGFNSSGGNRSGSGYGNRPGAQSSTQWQHFGGGQAAGQRSAAPANQLQGRQGNQGSGQRSTQGQHFGSGQTAGQRSAAPAQQFQGGQRYQAPAQRSSAPAQNFQGGQRYSAPAQRYSAPAQNFQGGQRYSAPAQRSSAPARNYQSAPRASAPSSSGGGRSFGGGNTGGGHTGGGSSAGGGGHRR
ncbi:MAG: DUF3300 domain-containing protein [Candidatus Sulfopaludibacter sp.]|nr:DUF3300 domain-containing protein [Candidatus Sulfopaludibacter sp.]